jgi:hypothetical protein
MGKTRGALLKVLAALLTGVAVGPVADTAHSSFVVRSAGCSPDGSRYSRSTRNVHLCRRDDLIWAVLQSGTKIEYELCIKFGAQPISCKAAVGDHSAAPYLIITKHFLGTITVSWRVDGVRVGHYAMQFVEYPAIPPFGVSPLIVSGTHRLFGLVVRHIFTGSRVRAWGPCHGDDCELSLRLVSVKGHKRRYRVAESRRNSLFFLGDHLSVSVDAPGRRAQGTELWSRLYTGVFVRDHSGGPDDTAIRRLVPFCNPPGLPFGFGRPCWKVSWMGEPTNTVAGPRTTRPAS